jgi:hypothetical protein
MSTHEYKCPTSDELSDNMFVNKCVIKFTGSENDKIIDATICHSESPFGSPILNETLKEITFKACGDNFNLNVSRLPTDVGKLLSSPHHVKSLFKRLTFVINNKTNDIKLSYDMKQLLKNLLEIVDYFM